MRRAPFPSRFLLVAAALLGADCSSDRDQRLYDLSYTLPIAEQRHEERSVDLGTPQARAAMVRGWSWNEKTDRGTTFVWSVGSESTLELFLLERRPLELRMRAFAHPELYGDPGVTVAVELNGAPLGSMEPGETFSEAVLAVSAEVQRLGNNRLTLHPSATFEQAGREISVAWDRIALGPVDSEKPTATLVSRDGLLLPAGIQVAWPLELGPNQELVLEGIALQESTGDGPSGLRVILDTGGASELLTSIEDNTPEHRVALPLDHFSPSWLLLQTLPRGGAVRLDRAWILSATTPGATASRAPSSDDLSGAAPPSAESLGRP